MTEEQARVPKLRFPGFADAWEQRKLGEIVSWSKGSNLAKAVLNENKSGEEVIHYADLYKFAPVVHDVIHWSNSGEGTIIPDNSILFPMSDVTPVGLARTTTITKTAVKAGSDTIIGTVEDKQSAEFISYQVNAHSPKILPLVTGTTVRHISAGALATLDVLLPSKDEQKKIADVFNGLSDLIALHQRKLSHLGLLKRGLLQKMFPKLGEACPEIRFPGFADAWEQRKLGDVVRLAGGGTPSKANPSFWNGDIVWLSSQEIKGRFTDHGTYKISQEAVRKSAAKMVQIDTPLIVYRSGILAHSFPITRPTVAVAINQDIKALLFDHSKLNTQFVVSQLESKEEYILRNIVKTGTTVQSVNIPDFVRMPFSVPNIAEQSELAEFFASLDDLIALHQRKLSHLQQQKKALLQQMFV